MRYVPVSLISTPPTITTTARPYGEIVNQEFYREFSRASQPGRQQSSRRKAGRRVEQLAPAPV